MKIVRFYILGILLAIGALGITSCDNSSSKTSTQEQTEETGPEYTSAYVCPMHCEGSGSSEPGKCPVCGMDYVANDKADHSDHDHDGHDHDGHDH